MAFAKFKEVLRLVLSLSKAYPYIASLVYTAFFCLFAVLVLDKPVLELAYRYKDSAFGENVSFLTFFAWPIWWYLLSFGAWIGFMAAAGVSLSTDGLEKNWQRARSFLFMLLAIVLTDTLIILIKIMVGRYRPEIWIEEGIYGIIPFSFDFLTSAFPAMTAGTIAAAMTAFWLIYPRYDIFYGLFALLIVFCLVASGEEFLADTVFGAYLGIVLPLCLNKLYKRRGITVRMRSKRDAQWQQVESKNDDV